MTPDGNNKAAIVRNLQETSIWLSLDNPLRRTDGRTQSICPDVNVLELLGQSTHFANWSLLAASVQSVIQKRGRAIARLKLTTPQLRQSIQEVPVGRWLLYDPAGADFSHMASTEPDSVFDEADCPGWDYWVWCINTEPSSQHLFSNAIIAWVPLYEFTHFQNGIRVMTGSAVEWADHPSVKDTPAAQLLQSLSLLAPG